MPKAVTDLLAAKIQPTFICLVTPPHSSEIEDNKNQRLGLRKQELVFLLEEGSF